MALAWSPEDPLRFRVIEKYMSGAKDSTTSAIVVLEIVNTSDFPLRLFRAHICTSDIRKLALGNLGPECQVDPSIFEGGGEFIELEGGERVRVLASVIPTWNNEAAKAGARVDYLWISKIEYRFASLWMPMKERLPNKVRGFVPEPESSRDQVVLESLVEGNGP
ncbi:MAG TPA: hypothetical protein VLE43_13105 [Candidatus Saccharimonadia bacterium]|nr:hypothetical protein [Candidatus Saccharimonadia bacterium]